MNDIKTGLTKPTIHINGTCVANLAEYLGEARSALHVALNKVYACAPNGRDYYPQGDQALRNATAEHLGRVKMLTEVARDIDELYLHVTEDG